MQAGLCLCLHATVRFFFLQGPYFFPGHCMLQNGFNNKVKNDSLLFVILILSLLEWQLLSPAVNLCKQL